MIKVEYVDRYLKAKNGEVAAVRLTKDGRIIASTYAPPLMVVIGILEAKRRLNLRSRRAG